MADISVQSQQWYFIVNPIAGKKNYGKIIPKIKEFCNTKGIPCTVAVTEAPTHATLLAQNVPAGNLVIAVGGDGTTLEVAMGVLKNPFKPAMAILPTGTGNDLSHSLRLPLKLEDALNTIYNGTVRQMDYIEYGEGKLCINVMSIGYDARVVHDHLTRYSKLPLGRFSYYVSAFLCCFYYRSIPVSLTVDGVLYEKDILLLAFANGIYYGGGMKVNPNGDPCDGRLNLVMAEPVGPLGILKLLPSFITGKFIHLDIITYLPFKQAEIRLRQKTLLNVDGGIGKTDSINLKIIAGGLSVVVG